MRKSMVLAVFLVLVLGVAAPAWAQQDGEASEASEAFVVLSGRADVPRGQTVGDLVVFHGSASVDGTVDGSLTALDAPVTISGRVNGDVVVFNGRVELQSGANVAGDVVSQQAQSWPRGRPSAGPANARRPTPTGRGSAGSAASAGGWPCRC